VAHGQIAFDGSLGPTGPVVPSGNTFRINATADGISGRNLFHSFSEFSIPSGMVADFESPAAVHRIIARVTGGAVSEIDGLLKTSGSDADFFLINPKGVLFGDGARIDVGGSFTASTAEVLIDGDGIEHSMLAGGAVLFSAPIEAFGFLAAVAGGDVAIHGAALQNPGGGIQLIGRNVSFSQANVSTGGDLDVRAVGEGAAMVPLDFHAEASGGDAGHLTVDGSLLRSGGGKHRIALFGDEVDVSSSWMNFDGFNQVADGGIRIGAGSKLNVTDGSVLGSVQLTGSGDASIDIRSMGRIVLDDSLILSLTRSAGTGANIRLDAADLVIEGNGMFDLKGILSLAEGNATGGAVDVNVPGGIRMSNNALLGSVTFNNATGGGVMVRAGEIAITGPSLDNASAGFLTGIIGLSYDSSEGGDLDVEAAAISLHRGGLIDSSSFGTGDGGNIKVRAGGILADRAGSPFLTGIGSDTEIDGTGGSVTVFADEITLLGGGLISSSTSGAGNAGSLRVEAERFTASGSGADSSFVAATHSGLAAVTANKGQIPSGNGGNIVIHAGSVRLGDRAGISTISEETGKGSAGLIEVMARDVEMTGGSVISSAAFGAGEAGGVVLTAGRVSLADSSLEVSAAANNAGSLSIASTGEVVLLRSLLSATASGAGRGGDVVVSGRNVTIRGDGGGGDFGIVASTLAGSSGLGGSVRITAGEDLVVERARVAAESLGSGDAGSLSLVAGKRMVLRDQGEVSARALGSGSGGSVGLSADELRLESGARVVAATTGSGSAGRIELTARTIDVAGVSAISSAATGSGEAGGVVLDAGRVSISESRAEVSALSNNGGELRVSSAGEILLSNSLLSATAGGAGRGGDVVVSGREVTVRGGGRGEAFGIVASTLAGSRGLGGSVRITADGGLVVAGSRFAAESLGSGDAGSLSLVAGQRIVLRDQGEISARGLGSGAGGNIRLSADEIRLASGARVEAATTGAGSAGRIELTARTIEVAGGSVISSAAAGSGVAGGVVLKGGRVGISGSRAEVSAISNNAGELRVSSTGDVMLSNSLLSATAGGKGIGGDVVVSGREVVIRGDGGGKTSGIVASTLAESSGLGGSVRITADEGLVVEGARVAAESLGSGGAGSLSMLAGKRIVLRDQGEVSARALGSGAGGKVRLAVSGGRLVVTDGGRISSSSDVAGDAGRVRLEASVLELRRGGVVESLSTGRGKAGGIVGSFDDVMVDQGSIRVASSATDAGSIKVQADGRMEIRGGVVSATAGGLGTGGNVILAADELRLASGARVEAATSGSGSAGRIELTGSTLDVAGGSLISSAATCSGNAGSVRLSGGRITLSGRVTLSVLAARGNAGSIRVLADGDLIGERVEISANAGNDGGNIKLRSGGLIFLNHSTASADAGGSGGNITFGGARHLVLNHTPVSASAVERDGGNIFVSTGTFFANSSLLSVTSERGEPGTIRIETLDVLDGGFEQEEPDLLDPNDVLQPSCSERAPDVGSSFTRAGKGSTPRLPGGFVPSFRIVE
jgi:filamentous hemagglutinin family protein